MAPHNLYPLMSLLSRRSRPPSVLMAVSFNLWVCAWPPDVTLFLAIPPRLPAPIPDLIFFLPPRQRICRQFCSLFNKYLVPFGGMIEHPHIARFTGKPRFLILFQATPRFKEGVFSDAPLRSRFLPPHCEFAGFLSIILRLDNNLGQPVYYASLDHHAFFP